MTICMSRKYTDKCFETVPNIKYQHGDVITMQVDIIMKEVKKDDTADEAGNY